MHNTRCVQRHGFVSKCGTTVGLGATSHGQSLTGEEMKLERWTESRSVEQGSTKQRRDWGLKEWVSLE